MSTSDSSKDIASRGEAVNVPPINLAGIRRALRIKFVSDSMLLFLGCAVGVFGFCWFRIWIVGNLDTKKFRQIIDLLPDDWRNFASVDFDWLVSYIGRTSLTLDEPTLVSFVCLWVLVRGSDVVSGEVNRGTMELLAAQPVSRKRLYFSHASMTLVGLVLLMGLTWLGMAAGIWTTSVEESVYPVIRIPLVGYEIPLTFLEPRTENVPMSSEVNPLVFFPGVFNLFCIGFFLGGLAAMCSAMDRYRWRTLGILAAIYFSGALMKMLAMAKESYDWINYVTFFGYYHPASAIVLCQDNAWEFFSLTQETSKGMQLAPVVNCVILLVVGAVFYAVGYRVFERRDIPAPL
ncbi:MAG: ABC transporter permease subunit [Planctomycetota bacterium]